MRLRTIAEAAAAIPGATERRAHFTGPDGRRRQRQRPDPGGGSFDSKNAIFSRLRIVTPGYLEAMRIPMLRGRATHRRRPPGWVEGHGDQRVAREGRVPWPGPIGKRIACCESGPDGKSPDYKTVVGVVGDVRSRGPGEAPSPEFYLPVPAGPDRGLGLDPAHDVHASCGRHSIRIR